MCGQRGAADRVAPEPDPDPYTYTGSTERKPVIGSHGRATFRETDSDHWRLLDLITARPRFWKTPREAVPAFVLSVDYSQTHFEILIFIVTELPIRVVLI